MSDAKESLKRGLKRGLLLVGGLILAALALTAFQMLTAPKEPQKTNQRPR
jgi:hypothetical protein